MTHGAMWRDQAAYGLRMAPDSCALLISVTTDNICRRYLLARAAYGLQSPDLIAGEESQEISGTVSEAVVENQAEQRSCLLPGSQQADRGGLQECYLERSESEIY